MAKGACIALICLGFASAQDTLTEDIGPYQKQLEANPRSSFAHFRLGEIFLRRNNLQVAANEFREALNGDLQPPWVATLSHKSLAYIFNRTGQPERAARELAAVPQTPTTPTVLPDGVYQISNAVAPVLLEKTDPEYSQEALAAGLEGVVSLDVVIAEDGKVRDAAVTQSLGLGLDEKAIEAVRNWRYQPGAHDGQRAAVASKLDVAFYLPSKLSRWHLIRAEFDTPEGALRPRFVHTSYPGGLGIGSKSLDQGKLLSAIGRLGSARVTFEINERGEPAHVEVNNFSDLAWAAEAVDLIRDWRFTPSFKDGRAITATCRIDVIWGPPLLNDRSLKWGRDQLAATAAVDAPPWETSYLPGIRRLKVVEAVQAAKLITKVIPTYPQIDPNIVLRSGTVRFKVLIGADGHVVDLYPMYGSAPLLSAAEEAVKQWVYRPTIIDGAAFQVATEIEVDFEK